MRTLALLFGLTWLVPASAHPPPVPEDTESASEMLRRKARKTPYLAIAGDVAHDKKAYGRDGYLDIESLRVIDADPLVVEIELFEALEPDPGGLIVFLVVEGRTRFDYAAYRPEEGDWGLFALSGRNIYEKHVGSASYTREDTVMTVSIPRADIPLDDFLVHIHTLSGPDNDNLWKDEVPNERKGIGVPTRAEEDVARQRKN